MVKSFKRDIGIDMIKGIACIAVMVVHRPFPTVIGGFLVAIARTSVAFFFMCSGYYLYNSSSQIEISRIKKRCTNLIVLLLIALSFYFVWESALRFVGSGSPSLINWIRGHVCNIDTWFRALVLDYDPFAGHLWFLFALIRCYLLMYFFIHNQLIKYLKYVPLGGWCTIIALEYLNVPLILYRNGWLYGFSCFVWGYYIAQSESLKLWFSREKYNRYIVLSIVIIVIEYIFVGEFQMYMGTVLLGSILLCNALNMPCASNRLCNWLACLGADYSTIVYIIHWSIAEVFIKLDKELFCSSSLWYLWAMPILLIICSIIMSVVIKKTYYLCINKCCQ